MKSSSNSVRHLLQEAYQALQKGDRRHARRLAEQATLKAPEREEPWLLLAAVASPEASLAYLNKALEINPESERARQGMHWAIQRIRAQPASRVKRQRIIIRQPTTSDLTRTRSVFSGSFLPLVILLFAVISALFAWYGTPTISRAFSSGDPLQV